MSKETLRLRMFAGPNGSGKSTFKSIIRPELLGIFINPDEIEKRKPPIIPPCQKK
jgi:predicted ABC-type ATPase